MATGFVLLATGPSLATAKPRCAGKKATMVGGNGRDLLKGGPRPDVVVSRGGNDRIFSGGGRDIVCSGPGDDVVRVGPGKDRVNSGAGDDFVDGAGGSDVVASGAGNDVVLGGPGGEKAKGGPGDDRLHGEFQDDVLRGDAGNDVLSGDQGADRLWGASGDDWVRGDTGYDLSFGGPGIDWLNMGSHVSPGQKVFEPAGVYTGPGTVQGEELTEFHVVGFENVVGTAFDDIFRDYPGTILGLSGNDQCRQSSPTQCGDEASEPTPPVAYVQGQGLDPGLIVRGGPAADSWRLTFSPGSIRIATGGALTAGDGCTTAPGAVVCARPAQPLGYVVLAGSGGDDSITMADSPGRPTYVVLEGGDGSDRLESSNAGELLLAGRDGRDALIGNGGNDFLFSRAGGDRMLGGAGEDQLTTSDPCAGHLFSGGPGGPDIAGFAQTRSASRLTPGWGDKDKTGVYAKRGGKARLRGTYLPETERGPEAPCTATRIRRDNEILEGTTGDDVLIGTNGPDPLIIGREGNDKISGRGGPDRLRGEGDEDLLFGGAGFDFLEAGDKEQDRRLDCGPGGGRVKRDKQDPRARRCRG
jgi:Ca2+-binding RTX toxin-like protein